MPRRFLSKQNKELAWMRRVSVLHYEFLSFAVIKHLYPAPVYRSKPFEFVSCD